MRCKNCGWPNEDNVTRCIKCNSPLTGSFIGNNNQSVNTGGDSLDNPADLKATLRDCSGGNSNNISSDNNPGGGAGGFCPDAAIP